MPEDWTLDRLVSFALSLGTLEALDPATIQELGEGLAFLVQVQASTEARYVQVIQAQQDTIAHQQETIARLVAACQCQGVVLEQLRAGLVLLGEERDAP